MANFLISPNMNLPIPVVGVDPGPDYGNNIDASFTLIDQHDHSPGHGVQITPTGLNINVDLPLNGNNLTLVRSVRFDVQGAPLSLVTDLSCLYSVTESGSNGDLWYNDASGNQIQITKTGAVLATISALISGTNEASFVANQLVVNSVQSNGTPANIKFGSALLGNNSAGTNFLTLQPPNAMASSYSVTLPPPNSSGGTAFLEYDASNNIIVGPSSSGASAQPGDLIHSAASTRAGCVPCDGTSYLRTAFPALFAAIGTAYGAADGTHFNVPLFTGMFLRITDATGVNDPDFASRTANNPGGNTGGNVGSQQVDALTTHNHEQQTVPASGGTFDGSTLGNSVVGTSPIVPGTVVPGGTFTIVSSETRPKNVYVNIFIKT